MSDCEGCPYEGEEECAWDWGEGTGPPGGKCVGDKSEYVKLRHGERIMMTDDGRACILCQGHYPFASEHAHGLSFPRKGDNAQERGVFLCWECAIYLYNRLSAQVSSIAYGALFRVRDPIRPTRFLPWLEQTAKNAPQEQE